MKQIRTYIGIGSNLKNPIIQVRTAMNELAMLPDTKYFQSSQLYQTPPLQPVTDQPDFINAVMALDTYLPAISLLHELQKIEQQHGRERNIHWGPRTLDLDLLLYGEETIDTVDLKVPHPELTKRNFVLYPLHEIEPHLKLPNGKLLDNLLKNHQPPTKILA